MSPRSMTASVFGKSVRRLAMRDGSERGLAQRVARPHRAGVDAVRFHMGLERGALNP